MTWLDTAIIAVIVLSTVLSLFRGLVKEIMSLTVWVLSLWLGYRYSDQAAELFTGFIPYEDARRAAAFLSIFSVVFIAGALISRLASKLVRYGGMGVADRAFGAVFGLLRGMVIIAMLVLLLRETPLAQDQVWGDSRLAGYFEILSTWAMGGLGGESGDIGV